MLNVLMSWCWACPRSFWSNVFGTLKDDRAACTFKWNVPAPERASRRAKNEPLWPPPCNPSTPGGSRYRSVRRPLIDRKFPTVDEPAPTFASYVGVLNEPKPNDALPVGLGWSRPDLVTMCTIRLLFSPYSAGATPVISSMDCTASGEI